MNAKAAAVIERCARESRARLLAYLLRRFDDLAAAEDALADATYQAVRLWPIHGIPERPEAWLLTVARRRLIDSLRRGQTQAKALAALMPLTEEALECAESTDIFPDDRVRLLFACAHPGLDSHVHTPLMLQVVLGLDAVRIAACLLVKPATLGQRLSRAKSKIRQSGLGFQLPEAHDLPTRLPPVLDAIYAAFTIGRDRDGPGPMTEAALNLAQILAQWRPDDPESLGLLALLLHVQARAATPGPYIPLSRQDPTQWDNPMIDQADFVLAQAAQHGRPGRFQLEAAIQAVHNNRRVSGLTDWSTIAILYRGLLDRHPSLGAQLGYAAALAETEGPQAAWAFLAALPADRLADHAPFWSLRAHLCQELHRPDDARQSLRRAMALCTDPARRTFLAQWLATLEKVAEA